jgi:hypothetical protein
MLSKEIQHCKRKVPSRIAEGSSRRFYPGLGAAGGVGGKGQKSRRTAYTAHAGNVKVGIMFATLPVIQLARITLDRAAPLSNVSEMIIRSFLFLLYWIDRRTNSLSSLIRSLYIRHHLSHPF